MADDALADGKKAAGRCFTGALENIPLAEVLHFLSLNRKTGRLGLTRRDAHALVVLRRGSLIYAASSSLRETLGNILVCRGLISEAVLAEALERQQFSPEEKRLGTVLVEMGQVSPRDVEQVVKYQTGQVLTELCQWTTGFFKFDAMEIPETGEIEVDAQDFVVMEALSTDRLLLEIATQLDESRREQERGGPPSSSDEVGSARAATAVPEAEATVPSVVPLRGILAEVQSPALRGEITLMLMRFATRIVGRGVLFAVRGDELASVSYFGFEGQGLSGHDPVRSLRLSLSEPSVFSEVIERKETYRGPLPSLAGNDQLVRQLGGRMPGEVVAIPMLVAGSVALIFYGDDVPQGRPVGSVRPLELVLTEAGLEMEKDALEGRIKSFERRRRRAEFLCGLLRPDAGFEGAAPSASTEPPASTGRGPGPTR